MVGNLQGASPSIAVTAEIIKNNDKSSKTTNNVNSSQDSKVFDKIADKDNVSSIKSEQKNGNQENVVDYSKIAKKMESAIANNQFEIQYSVDKDTKKLVFKLINKKTKETVEQYPPEVALKISKIVTQALDAGHLTDATV